MPYITKTRYGISHRQSPWIAFRPCHGGRRHIRLVIAIMAPATSFACKKGLVSASASALFMPSTCTLASCLVSGTNMMSTTTGRAFPRAAESLGTKVKRSSFSDTEREDSRSRSDLLKLKAPLYLQKSCKRHFRRNLRNSPLV